MSSEQRHNRGLVVGRFQPFHYGHLHAVKYALSRVKELVIAIGSALESHTLRNPFTTSERIQMISLALEEAKIPRERFLMIPVPDIGLHTLWVPLVEMLTPPFGVVFTNDPLTSRLFLERGYEVKPIPFLNREIYSGTEFRRRVIEGGNWSELVPSSVAAFLSENGLLDRLKELAR